MPKLKKPELLTPREAAKIIGCSIHHVRVLIRSDKLPAMIQDTDDNQHGYRFGIKPADAEAYAKIKHRRGWPRGKKRQKDELQ